MLPDPRALAAERERLAKEEQRKREFEIQKRKLRGLDVANPAPSLDDLLGKNLMSGLAPPGTGSPAGSQRTPSPAASLALSAGSLPGSSHSLSSEVAGQSTAGELTTETAEAGISSVKREHSPSAATGGGGLESQAQWPLSAQEGVSGTGTKRDSGGVVRAEEEEEWGEFDAAQPSTGGRAAFSVAVDKKEKEEEEAEEENKGAPKPSAGIFVRCTCVLWSSVCRPPLACH